MNVYRHLKTDGRIIEKIVVMKNRNQKNNIVVVGIGCLFLAACGTNNQEFDASGTFEATEIVVSAEANGKIMQLNLQEGDQLQAGAEVGYIDSTQLFLKKQQLTARLRAVDVQKPDIHKQMAVLKQQIATAKNEVRRQQNLVNAKAGNQKQLDDWQNQLQFFERQLEAQRSSLHKATSSTDAEVESIQYQVMQLDDQLVKSRIRNPQTGTVLVKYTEASEMTTIGKPIYKLADTSLLYLRAYITAKQLSQLKLGQSVDVFADYDEDYKKYEGTLTWISAKAEFTPKGIQTKDERANLVYAIKIAVRNDGYLKIGQYGEVKW